MSNIGGLRFNGVTDWLGLPSTTFTSIQIDCYLDGFSSGYQYVLGSYGSMFRLDPNSGYEGSGVSWTGATVGTRTTLTVNGSFSGGYTIFANVNSGGNVTKGTLYAIRLYNNGSLVLSYDLTKQSNIQGNKVFDSVSGTYNGTLYGSPQFIGVQSQGLQFNGVSDAFSIPSLTADTIEITFAPLGSTSSSPYIFDFRTFLSSGYLYIGATSGLGGNSSVWNHVYLDGTDVQSTLSETVKISKSTHTIKAIAKTPFTATGNFMSIYNRSGGFLQGVLYSVKLWNGSTLVASYDFTNQSNIQGTTVLDISGNGKNGTITGSPQWAIKPEQQGVQFASGANNYIQIPYNSSLNTSQFTFESWFKISDVSGATKNLICNRNGNNGYYVAVVGNNVWAYLGTGSSFLNTNSGTINIPLNTLTHVCFIYNGSTAQLYINGVAVGTPINSTSYAVNSSSTTMFLGKLDTNLQWFNGTMFGERLFNTALSASQVTQQYQAGIQGAIRTNLVGEWCIDPSGKDTSGNNNNGTLTGTQANIKKEVQGIQFTGARGLDKIQIPSSASLNISTGGITLECLVCVKGTSGTEVNFIDKNGYNNYRIGLAGGGSTVHTTVTLSNGSSNSSVNDTSGYMPTLQLGSWYHLVYTFDLASSVATLYVNGVYHSSKSSGLTGYNQIVSGGSPLYLGMNSMYNNTFLGAIGFARIYNRAITATEAQQNYLGNVVRSGLVGEWLSSNSNGSTITDTSGNGNNGTLTGTKPNIKQAQQGVRFDGINGNYTIPFSSSLASSQFTYEAWHMCNNPSGSQYLICPTSGATGGFSVGTSGQGYNFATNTGQAVSYGTSVTNKLTHIVCTYDGTTAVIYLNGVQVASKALTYTVPSSGSYTTALVGTKYNGMMYAQRIFNRVLSPTEISNQYNAGIGKGVARNGLVCEVFTDGTGKDTSGNGNNATLTSVQSLIKTPLR